MNRYVIAGAVADAQSGKSVIVCCRSARNHLDEIAGEPGVEKVRRANGEERVDFQGGGFVRLVCTETGGLRGASADVIFLDRDGGERLTEDAAIAIVAKGGEVIRA